MTSVPPSTADVQDRLKPFLVDADPDLATPDKKIICREIAVDIATSTTINAQDSVMSPTVLQFKKKVSAITAGNLSTPVKDDLIFRVSAGLVNGVSKSKPPLDDADHQNTTLKLPESQTKGAPTMAPSVPPTNSDTPESRSYASLAHAQHDLGPDFKSLCGEKLLKKTNMISKAGNGMSACTFMWGKGDHTSTL